MTYPFNSMAQENLLDVAHVSKRGSSLRITIPKSVASDLNLTPKDIIGFYECENGILIRKIE